MVRLRVRGKYTRTAKYLENLAKLTHSSIFDKYGKVGVEALKNATPVDSGQTADSWSYLVKRNGDVVSVEWNNSNTNKGVNIAIILQLGHGTGTGGWVAGRDYITPSLQPVFDDILDSIVSEVKNA